MAISLEADTWTLSRSDADKSYSIDPSKVLDLSSAKKFQVDFWWKAVVGGGLICTESVLRFH